MKHPRHLRRQFVVGTALAVVGAGYFFPYEARAQTSLEQIKRGFVEPPADARPWTWFHVMSGNMSREGITKDLESLAEAGVGGIVLFHVTQGIPHGKVRFNSPEHLELITHVAAECERLGLKFNFHNADGWSSTGGPWVTPELSMKRVVWSEQLVDGGAVNVSLPQPPARAGLYRDIAVIAYPSLASEVRDVKVRPVITASDPALDVARIIDGNPDTVAELAVAKGETGWIQFVFDRPVTMRSLVGHNVTGQDFAATLQMSQDGVVWRDGPEFGLRRIGKNEMVIDEAFDPVEARYFRISSASAFALGEIALSAIERIPNVVAHTSMSAGHGVNIPRRLEASPDAIIDPAKIIDLTNALSANGSLFTKLPRGKWTVLRFGYTTTGAINVNASPEGSGLEVDKFSPDGYAAQHRAFIEPVLTRTRAVAPNALSGVMIDSYEVGGQNWTDTYPDLFKAKFGQSIIPWLPLYAGRYVKGQDETRDMLAGIRDLNADLVRDNYYGAFANAMEQQGVHAIIQPYGNGPFKSVDIGSAATLPTGEFWMVRANMKLNDAVSAARIYGRNIVAAEAFTGEPRVNWRFSPAMGKKWGDRAWTAGVNQFMFHRFAHQANTHVMPGMTMNRWGSHFDRTQPWWDKAGKAWFEYMARGHHLLRQGMPVADIALYMGDDSPGTCPEKSQFADRLPAGVEYDCINAETLLFRSRFAAGQLELPNGAQYSMIWWPRNHAPDPAGLSRLYEARAAGVPVVLANDGEDAKASFARAGLTPRILSDGPMPMFTHRRDGETDIFFLLNFDEQDVRYNLTFPAIGHAAELWDPVTGAMTALPTTLDDAGQSRITLALLAGQSAFVVFSPANVFAPASPVFEKVKVAIDTPWTISFDPLYSEQAPITLPALIDLSTSDNDEVRHYSGKLTYRTAFNWVPDSSADQRPILLDLGKVEVAASIRLNGVDLGTLWTTPFAIDVTKAILPGENLLEVEVANLWVNRLIGDERLEDTSGFVAAPRVPTDTMVEWYSANLPPPPGPRRTFTTQPFFKVSDPLVPSGLIGPVQIIGERKQDQH